MKNVRFTIASSQDCTAIALLHFRSHTIAYHYFLGTEWAESRDLEQYKTAWCHHLADEPVGERTWIAWSNNQVVGSVTVAPAESDDQLHQSPECADSDKASIACIKSIHVDPDYTSKGIGTKLMQKTLEDMIARGYTVATLVVHEANTQARRWYETCGWQAETLLHKRSDKTREIRYCINLTPKLDPPKLGFTNG